jgi:uncharacterized protein YdeI (YjbR/CyaY-like superfamily)
VEPVFFATPQEMRAWLAENGSTATELWVGYYKRETGRPSVTWPESVDQALCFGWIDGVRKRIDDERYVIRFTPRKRSSIWSAVNIKRMGELRELGLVEPAGLAAFEQRREDKSALYSYENRPRDLPEEYAARFQAYPDAWAFFQSWPPSLRRSGIWWVLSAKKEETRQRRLEQLIEQCVRRERIDPRTPASMRASSGGGRSTRPEAPHDESAPRPSRESSAT